MSDFPRDYLLGRIEELERSNRRWKALALVLVFGLGFMLLLGAGVTAILTVKATSIARQAEMEHHRALAAQQEAEMQRQQAEQSMRKAQEAAEKHSKP